VAIDPVNDLPIDDIATIDIADELKQAHLLWKQHAETEKLIQTLEFQMAHEYDKWARTNYGSVAKVNFLSTLGI
jgi:hypothetical protein